MKAALDVIGNPIVALFITVVVAVFALGVRLGESLDEIQRTLNRSLEPIAAAPSTRQLVKPPCIEFWRLPKSDVLRHD